MDSIAVKCMTCTSALGRGMTAMRAALTDERTGLVSYECPEAPLTTSVGRVADLDTVVFPEGFEVFDCRNNRLAEMALGEDGFSDEAASAVRDFGADRVGVVLGTSTSGIGSTERVYADHARGHPLSTPSNFSTTHDLSSLSRFVAERLGAKGPCYTISTACSSSTRSFSDGARLIAAGLCDAVIVGGVDSLCETSIRGFNALQLLSPGPCRPNDRDRDGISIGEAGGFALLTRADTNDRVVLSGIGESSDAYHMSSPHPEGKGAIAAMRSALETAGLTSKDIDYVNMHGTGSVYNDKVEDMAIAAVLGEGTPCSSTKGFSGHTLGGAGILEAAVTVTALTEGFIPANLNLQTADPELKCRIVGETIQADLTHVMTNNFGFGGNNCVLIFSGRG
ncbi:MAG: beta-ketoacyl-ACP synthase [Rhodospirillales bacterium]|nr:beta-ketoacyl-ACP synthase [Rhodospirillales bacterium]